jgi:glycerol-3-phosphate cytidylyltransferase-like family protein
LLKEAKALGDELVVVVALDKTVEQLKGRLPYHSEGGRKKQIENTGLASRVRLGSSGDKLAVVREEKPDMIALGYDQTFFTKELEETFGATTAIVRLQAFKPDIYKSSLLRP